MSQSPAPAWLPRPQAINPAFSTWLDFFRWTAALAVCLAHVRAIVMADFSPGIQPAWLARLWYFFPGFGHYAVIIFFVLSGYLVGGEVLKNFHRGEFAWSRYLGRRFARLYPGLLVALLLGGLLDFAGLHWFNASGYYTMRDNFFTMIGYPIADRLTPAVLLGNLCFCQTILTPTFGSNGALWTLANEVWYYVIFALAIWVSSNGRRFPSRALGGLLLLGMLWFVGGRIVLYFSVWLLGVLAHALPRPASPRPLLAGGGMIALLIAARFYWLAILGGQWPVDLVVGAAFAWLLRTLEPASRPAPGPAVLHQRLAGFAYTTYLLHWPLALFLMAILGQVFGVSFRQPFSAVTVGLTLALVAIIHLGCWALYPLSEGNTARIRRWLFGPANESARNKTA